MYLNSNKEAYQLLKLSIRMVSMYSMTEDNVLHFLYVLK